MSSKLVWWQLTNVSYSVNKIRSYRAVQRPKEKACQCPRQVALGVLPEAFNDVCTQQRTAKALDQVKGSQDASVHIEALLGWKRERQRGRWGYLRVKSVGGDNSFKINLNWLEFMGRKHQRVTEGEQTREDGKEWDLSQRMSQDPDFAKLSAQLVVQIFHTHTHMASISYPWSRFWEGWLLENKPKAQKI